MKGNPVSVFFHAIKNRYGFVRGHNIFVVFCINKVIVEESTAAG